MRAARAAVRPRRAAWPRADPRAGVLRSSSNSSPLASRVPREATHLGASEACGYVTAARVSIHPSIYRSRSHSVRCEPRGLAMRSPTARCSPSVGLGLGLGLGPNPNPNPNPTLTLTLTLALTLTLSRCSPSVPHTARRARRRACCGCARRASRAPSAATAPYSCAPPASSGSIRSSGYRLAGYAF